MRQAMLEAVATLARAYVATKPDPMRFLRSMEVGYQPTPLDKLRAAIEALDASEAFKDPAEG